MISRLVLIYIIVSLFASQSFSQTGVLKGVVYDFETRETLPGATIQLVNDLTKGVATDMDGHYLLELDTGYHQLVCSFISLKTYTFSVHIVVNAVTEQDVFLKSGYQIIRNNCGFFR